MLSDNDNCILTLPGKDFRLDSHFSIIGEPEVFSLPIPTTTLTTNKSSILSTDPTDLFSFTQSQSIIATGVQNIERMAFFTVQPMQPKMYTKQSGVKGNSANHKEDDFYSKMVVNRKISAYRTLLI